MFICGWPVEYGGPGLLKELTEAQKKFEHPVRFWTGNSDRDSGGKNTIAEPIYSG